MASHISQREARRLRRRVAVLEHRESGRKSRWSTDYPGGINFATEDNVRPTTIAALTAARALGHYVVAVPDSIDGRVRFYAMPWAEK